MKYSGITEQQKASVHRQLDADRLQSSNRWRGAMYLLGYAVECSLKARLMEKYGVLTLSRLQDRLSVRFKRLKKHVDIQTHSLTDLMTWTESEHRMDPEIKKLWGTFCKWTVDWRYNPDEAGKTECERFFEAGHAVLSFMQKSI